MLAPLRSALSSWKTLPLSLCVGKENIYYVYCAHMHMHKRYLLQHSRIGGLFVLLDRVRGRRRLGYVRGLGVGRGLDAVLGDLDVLDLLLGDLGDLVEVQRLLDVLGELVRIEEHLLER